MAVTPAQVLKYVSQEGSKILDDVDTNGQVTEWIRLATKRVQNFNPKISGDDLDILVILDCAGELKRFMGISDGKEYDEKYDKQLDSILIKYNQKATLDTTNTKTILRGKLPDYLTRQQ